VTKRQQCSPLEACLRKIGFGFGKRSPRSFSHPPCDVVVVVVLLLNS